MFRLNFAVASSLWSVTRPTVGPSLLPADVQTTVSAKPDYTSCACRNARVRRLRIPRCDRFSTASPAAAVLSERTTCARRVRLLAWMDRRDLPHP